MVQKLFLADDRYLNDVLSFVEEELNEAKASLKIIRQVKICVEEIFVNIAHYAYGDENGEVEISILYNEKERVFTFVFEDTGKAYNPLERKDPDITLSAEERGIGGLGIFICKKTMDDIQYRYEKNKNVLIMTKNI